MGRSTVRALFLAMAVLPALAFGWPVDRVEELKVDEARFYHPGSLGAAEVKDPSVASAERMPTGELLLTGKSPGETLLLTLVEGKPFVWRIRVVGKKPLPPRARDTKEAKAQAERTCPGLEVTREAGQAHLRAAVHSDGCRRALRTLLEGDDYLASSLELSFDLPTLQAQLRDDTQAAQKVAPGATLSFLGAGLWLKGTATPAEHRALLWELFFRSVGRLPLNDELAAPEDTDPSVRSSP